MFDKIGSKAKVAVGQSTICAFFFHHPLQSLVQNFTIIWQFSKTLLNLFFFQPSGVPFKGHQQGYTYVKKIVVWM